MKDVKDAKNNYDGINEEDTNRYILFWLNNELYGTPLLSAREVVEQQPVKTIPNTTPYFLGVINIRGEIIGLIDLKRRFGLEQTESANASLVVFESHGSSVAASVDKLEAVVSLRKEDIEENPNISVKVPMEYLVGIGKYEDRLVTILDLQRILDAEDFIVMKNKMAKGA
jgi:purine-binding chemotaxis protein CheW